ncbi:uncharacterized protein LOC113879497 isoform X1 [Bos indicus x Bos taurus]|uniref:uncharacterized protein LOC113879497 isoform X1 n=1 Tax=Bos indicus x Bos taurus TaxID=30522 RepID=UPI0007606E48|nr:uncharacterized protein LOC113879497 isoform X1 [Bos indicus x Bos taurus]
MVMLRTGPQGFLLGSFICLRGGQLAFPALATEGEHLARNRGDCCKMSFTSQDFSSSQAVTWAVSTITFFFSEAFLGQHFEAVELEDNEPEPGDLFLFRLMSPTGHWCGAHVGKNPRGHGPHLFLGSCEGIVSKQGQRPMLRSRLLWRVLHRRDGIDHVALERRGHEAMDTDPPPYHPMRSNCVHFALQLLGPGPNLDPVQVVRTPMTSVSVDVDLTVD